MSQGFLFVATSDEFVREAKVAASVIKRHTDKPISVVAHREVDSDMFDTVIIDEAPHRSFDDKPRNLLKTPYEKTVYLDTDIYMLSSVPGLFDLLEQTDIATTIDPTEFELRVLGSPGFPEIPESIPIYQTGVIAYRKDPAAAFIKKWENIHTNEGIERDQVSFRAALYYSDVNHRALGDVYNCLSNSPMQVIGDVKFLHDTDNSISIEKHEFSSLDEFARRVNEDTEMRLFVSPRQGKIYLPTIPILNVVCKLLSSLLLVWTSFRQSIRYLPQSITKDGLVGTGKKAIKKFQ